MTVIVDADYVTNYFLYGQSPTPSHLFDENLIRPSSATTSFVVDAQSYMDKVGRFALPSQFEIIQKFFSLSYSYNSKLDSSGNVTYWTKQEIADMLGLSNSFYGLVVRQFEHDDGVGDYAERTLVWNSAGFKISDDAQFWIDADGTRHIENFAIVPIEDASGIDENFDLQSDSIITQLGNDFLLPEKLDPYNIGRRVNIDIQGNISRKSYNVLDYTSDLQTAANWSSPTLGSLKSSVDVLLDDLHSRGIISPVDGQGRPIEYGTIGNDNLTPKADQFHYYENLSNVGSVLIGGSGDDVITGSAYSDRLIAGADNDTLAGLGGDDLFDFSTGVNKIWGNGFLDYSSSSNELDIVDYSKTDKTLNVKFYSDNTHPYTIGVDGGNGNQDSLWSIEKIIGGTGSMSLTVDSEIPSGLNLTLQAGGGGGHVLRAPNQAIQFINSNGNGYVQSGAGKINLIGFTTDVVGSWDDDIIDDVGAGRKRIFGDDGNDTVHADGASVMIDGGLGDDEITGGAYNDVLIGGEGSDVLTGGAGSDYLVAGSAGESGDTLYGGDGHDYLINGHFMEGGAGNDIIDARGAYHDPAHNYGSIITFSAGNGHDIIIDDGFQNTPGSINGEIIDAVDGVGEIDFGTISKSDASFIWNANASIEYYSGNRTFYEATGNLAIVIGSAGDSVLFQNVYGHFFTEAGSDRIYTLDIGLPKLKFVDGNFRNMGDGYLNIPLSLGSTAAYESAVSDWNSATQSGPINGTSGNDDLAGGNGDDAISAGSGDDEVSLSGGNDAIDGGQGDDTLTFFGSIDGFQLEQITGGIRMTSSSGLEGSADVTGVESFYSITDDRTWSFAQMLGRVSTAGNDNMTGTEYSDNLFAGAGDDTLTGFGGDDTLDGGDGTDQAIYSGSSTDYAIAFMGSIAVFSLSANEGRDNLENIEEIYFQGDNVTILNTDLNFVMGATLGSDILIGGSSRDTVIAQGDDIVNAQDGNDVILRQTGNGSLDGGAGTDTIIYEGSSSNYSVVRNGGGSVLIDGQNVHDNLSNIETIFFSGDRSKFVVSDLPIEGTADGDFLIGSDDDDIIKGYGGDDYIDGGFGNDTAVFNGKSSDYIIASNQDGTFIVDLYGSDGGDYLNNVEQLYFNGDSQSISVGDLNFISDTSGNDVLNGGNARDTIFSLEGDDVVTAGSGDDVVIRGSGNSDIDGGVGSDIVSYSGTASDFVIVLNNDGSVSVTGEEVSDRLTNIERIYLDGDRTVISVSDLEPASPSGPQPIYGTSGNDTLVGTADGDTIYGGAGDDSIDGGAGADLIYGGTGNDFYTVDSSSDVIVESAYEGWDGVSSSVSYTLSDNVEGLYLGGESAIDGAGNDLDNEIYGNDYANTLSGLGGADYIVGGYGNDRLMGGAGDDLLAGEDGSADVAVYAGLQSSFSLATVDGTVTITDNAPTVDGDEGTDSLHGIEIVEFQGGIQAGISSPIILDLNGNGVTLVDNKRTKVSFDWDRDGIKNQTGWIGKDDGFLFIDRDGNGTVTNAGELSFTSDRDGAKSDLDGLRAFDSNGDGTFSSADDQFSQFKVWRDKNGNGRVDKKEILSLQNVGVASIDLTGEAVNQSWEWGENITVNTGSFTRTNGTVGSFSDVALSYDTESSQNAAINKAASQLSEAMAGFWDGRGTAAFGKFEALAERGDNFLAVARGGWR